ncbi:glycosyltransferase [Microbacterium lacticum]|uniref:glycosyltransferase n=1 Tax=Microbacterium lacticum TaxID=33885 RepID=UPI001F58B5D6|nr:glycosyltransferase [Microbacterium lacticum]
MRRSPTLSGARSAAAKALLQSGIFDHSFYAQISHELGRTRRQLAQHYVDHALASGRSPHPLIEIDFLPPAVREASRKDDGVAQLLGYLRTPDARTHAWGPLFDPRVLNGDPLTELAGWNSALPLPVPEDFEGTPPTLAQARSALLEFADQYGEQFAASLPPRRKKWDRTATQQWVAQITSAGTGSDALVSVIMPVLNRADMVGKAIESVLSQTHRQLELIVVDDGSTDSTRDIVAEYARADSRVRLLAGPHAGVSATRNTGLSEASGEFIAFLDSDNSWTRRFLELSLAALDRSQAVATHAALRLHGDEGSIEYRGGDAQLADLQLGNSVDLNVIVVRSHALHQVGHFDVTLRRWVDYDLVLRLAKIGRLEYLPFIGCEYDNKTTDGRITQGESLHWQWVVKERNLIDWSAVRAGSAQRIADRTSLVIVIAGATGHSVRSIDRLLHSFSGDLEIVIVDNGSREAIGRRLVLRYLSEPRVRYFRLPANNNFALAANYGYTQTTGECVAFLDSDADPRDGWLEALSNEQRESGALGVQGVLLNPDYTVQHAGYAFYDGVPLPSALLADLTIDDATDVDLNDLTAISASASLFDARAFADLSGFDPLYANGLEDVDLCLRARRDIAHANFSCTTRAIVIHERKSSAHRDRRQGANRRTYLERWSGNREPEDRRRYESLSMTFTRFAPTFGPGFPSANPVLMRDADRVEVQSSAAPASLRWAIKTGVPCTRGGDHWGDIPFANDLAKALRTQGQQVVIDRHEAWTRPTSYLDDVILTLRGRHAIPPQPGALNIMWVISRPDLVTVDEVRSYDVVFAASEKWAAWMSARAGRTVEPLLQATSPGRFRPDLSLVESPDDLIFVGGSHGHEYGRAIVGLALQADAPIGLWGPGWDKFAPAHAVRDGYMSAEVLPNAYRSANIVLNDHYADMAKWGFINNRTFDAIACGTPMISDEIDGLELFEGAVVVADSAARMRELVTDRSWMPSREKMSQLSALVRQEHTFDARARRLVSAAQARPRS